MSRKEWADYLWTLLAGVGFTAALVVFVVWATGG